MNKNKTKKKMVGSYGDIPLSAGLYVARRNFIAWKKVAGNKVIKLLVPKGARVVRASYSTKVRVDKVIPLDNGTSAFYHGDGYYIRDFVWKYYKPFDYVKGKLTHSINGKTGRRSFDTRCSNECSRGIYILPSKDAAMNYR